MNDVQPTYLPSYLVPHLPLPLSDVEAVRPENYRFMQLEDIRLEQTDTSYRLLEKMRDEWHTWGCAMILIEWRDGTQGVMCFQATSKPTDDDVLRAYYKARSKRELYKADGGRA